MGALRRRCCSSCTAWCECPNRHNATRRGGSIAVRTCVRHPPPAVHPSLVLSSRNEPTSPPSSTFAMMLLSTRPKGRPPAWKTSVASKASPARARKAPTHRRSKDFKVSESPMLALMLVAFKAVDKVAIPPCGQAVRRLCRQFGSILSFRNQCSSCGSDRGLRDGWRHLQECRHNCFPTQQWRRRRRCIDTAEKGFLRLSLTKICW